MAKTYYDEEGNAVEVPEEEEIKQKIAAEYEAKIKDLELKTKIDDDPVEKNWKLAREREKNLKLENEKLQSKLKEYGDDSVNQTMTKEQIDEQINRVTQAKLIEIRKNDALAGYEEEEKPIIEKYLQKVTYGETVTPENIVQFISEAERMAFPKKEINPIRRSITANGKPPRLEQIKFSDSERGQQLAQKLGIKI